MAKSTAKKKEAREKYAKTSKERRSADTSAVKAIFSFALVIASAIFFKKVI